MKIIFEVLVSSLRPLLSTLGILVFFYLIFAIAGLQLWRGLLKYRCFDTKTGLVQEDEICGAHECGFGYECAK